MKSWKSLFVKDEPEENEPSAAPTITSKKKEEDFSFPVTNTHVVTPSNVASNYVPPQASPANTVSDNNVVNEVLGVYEKGLDSINMPGYDFFEFYKAINSITNGGDQAYTMAFQMAKSMDNTLSPMKLMGDADFYISKINEVYSNYVTQGNQKLNEILNDKNSEKVQLNREVEAASKRLEELRKEMTSIEASINENRNKLTLVDGKYAPTENAIRQKLGANDNARQISIQRLQAVRDGILRILK
jgi:hypothetical protein